MVAHGRTFCGKEKALLPEDASQDAAEAAHAIVAAFRLCCAAQDHTQHASQSGGIDAVAFLAFAQQGQEARSDGSQDAAHGVGAHTRRLGDAAQHGREAAAKDMAQDLLAVDEVGSFQVVDDVACIAGMVAQGIGQRGCASLRRGVLLHGAQEIGQCGGDDRRHLFLVNFKVLRDGAGGIIARQGAQDVR